MIARAILAGLRTMGRSPVGRVVVRTAHQLSRQTARRSASVGALRFLKRRYEDLDEASQWIVEQITELAAEIAMNYVEGDLEVHVDEQDLNIRVERAAISLQDATVKAIKSRVIVVGQAFVFGKFEPSGKIIVAGDVIKQALIAAVKEILRDHSEETA